MAYAEFLRARRSSLFWHAAIMAAVTLLILYFGTGSNIQVDGHSALFPGMAVPLGQLSVIAMFFGAIYASSSGASLNRENATRDLSWTKPVPRTVLALQFILIDVAGIAIAFALTLVAIVAVLLRLQMVPVLDASFVPETLLALGVSVMWYALIQVLTFALPPGGRSIGGILWPVAFVLLGLASLPGPLGAIARTLDIFNPLSYASGISHDSGGRGAALAALPVEARLLSAWMFAVLLLRDRDRVLAEEGGVTMEWIPVPASCLRWAAYGCACASHSKTCRANVRLTGRPRRPPAKSASMTAPLDERIAFIRANRERYLNELRAWIACPSVSGDPAYAADVRASAETAAARMRAARPLGVRVLETAGHPGGLR